MGRYDRIKVYHNGQWKTPTEIKVRSGSSWVSLGTHTGDNQTKAGGGVRHLYRWNGTRITKEKQINSGVNYYYSYGSGSYYNDRWEGNTQVYSYQWDPNLSEHLVSCTIRKTSATDQNIFYSRDVTGSANYVYITWLANGQINIRTRYNNNAEISKTFNHTLNTNTWYTITVRALKLSDGNVHNYLYVDSTMVAETVGSASFEGINKEHRIGDTAIQFRNNLSIKTEAYPSNNGTQVVLDMSTNQSSNGFGYAADSYYYESWI